MGLSCFPKHILQAQKQQIAIEGSSLQKLHQTNPGPVLMLAGFVVSRQTSLRSPVTLGLTELLPCLSLGVLAKFSSFSILTASLFKSSPPLFSSSLEEARVEFVNHSNLSSDCHSESGQFCGLYNAGCRRGRRTRDSLSPDSSFMEGDNESASLNRARDRLEGPRLRCGGLLSPSSSTLSFFPISSVLVSMFT